MTATKRNPAVSMRLGDFQTRLTILLAGRAAEEKFFGEPSSGAGGPQDSDLARATKLAVRLDAAWGLDPVGGLLWRPVLGFAGLHEVLAADRDLEQRVRGQLDRAYSAARELVAKHADLVRAIAEALVDRRVLVGDEVQNMCALDIQLIKPVHCPSLTKCESFPESRDALSP